MSSIPKPAGKTLFFLLLSFAITLMSTAQDSLRVDSMILSNRGGLENILQGSVAGLRIKSWSGTPGTQSILNLRGLSLDPTDQNTMPLILINGVAIIASPSNVTAINPLAYFSPEQIDRIEVIKDIDRLAAYGLQAPNGAINFIIKEGQSGSIHVRANVFAGTNFLQNMDYRKDAYYNFNTLSRREAYGNGGFLNEQNVLVDGSGTYGSYMFGLSNHQDKGVIKNTGFGSQSLFLNAKYNISDRFTAHFYNNMALASRKGRYAGEYDRNFSLPVIDDESFFMDKNRNIGLLSTMGLTYRLGSGFTLSSVSGISYEGASRDVYVPSDVLDGNIYASSVAFKRQLITVNTTLNYLRDFSEVLRLDMTLGNEIWSADDRLTSVNGERSMESGGSNYVKIVTGYNASQTNALSDHVKEKMLSFYGIWKWKYKKDLGVNMVLRADGSSLYKDKWALYPALGIHYDLKNRLKLPVKINASVGKTGVAARPEVYQGSLDAYGDYYGGNYLGVGELYPVFDGAKSTGVTQIDAGFSVSLSSDIELSFDYFNKTYKDFTYQRFLANISGIDYDFETGGSVRLAGIEANLNAKWIQTNRFTWTSNLNFASYRNNIKELPGQIENTGLANLRERSESDALTSLVAYTATRSKIIGNSEPSAFGGFTNTFKYGNISAMFVLTYAWGADIIAESFSSRYYADRVDNEFPIKKGETPYYLIEEGENGRTVYQGIKTVEDGSFLRLSRAAISYNMRSIADKLGQLSNLEIFVRANNFFTLTRYSGINPEENISGTRRHDLRYTGTPLPASVALGLKLVF